MSQTLLNRLSISCLGNFSNLPLSRRIVPIILTALFALVVQSRFAKTSVRSSLYISLVLLFLLSDNRVFSQVSEKTSKKMPVLARQKESQTLEAKIDSRLLQVVKAKRAEKGFKGVNPNPANVNADENGNLLVDIKAEVSDELVNKIQKLGGKIIYPSKQYNTIRALIDLSMVDTIASFTAVEFIEPAAQARNNGAVKPGINQ